MHDYSTSDSTLINGKGRYAGGPNSELAVVSVQQGKRYRFRLLNLSCELTSMLCAYREANGCF